VIPSPDLNQVLTREPGWAENSEHSASLLEAIVHCSADAILTTTLDSTITSWNPAAVRLFGYFPEEIIGRSLLTLIPTRLQNEEREILRRLRAGEQISNLQTMRRDKNGLEHIVALTVSPVRGARGEILGTSRILRDITQQQRLDEARFRLAAIVESSEDAIISKDLSGRITSWNAAATRIFGYSEKEILGAPILKLVPREQHGEERTIFGKLSAGNRIEHYETVRVRKDGTPVDVSLTISPIRDESGTIIGASKILRDITERKRMEQSLLQAEKIAATGRMASTIAHEINNPLAAVLNLIYLARINAGQPEQVAELLTLAEGEMTRVAHVAQSTLGYYREQASPCKTSLAGLIKQALRIYEPQLRGATIEVRTHTASDAELMMRKGEIMQVVSNLITNAIHAMPNGGALLVKIEESNLSGRRGLRLSVEDEGFGIKNEHLEHIFEPFFTTRSEIRTGIGLWIAKKFIEEHAGIIEVHSSTHEQGHGTRMDVFLPFANPYAAKSLAS
jgi:PAS domain S-box-containing protein